MRRIAALSMIAFSCACSEGNSPSGNDAGIVIANDAVAGADAIVHADANPGMDVGEAADAEPGMDVEIAPDAAEPADGGMIQSTGPAVMRGGTYEGFPERFNRRYTEPTYQPLATIYISPNGGGDGTSRATPTTADVAVGQLAPGTEVVFLDGDYPDFCIDLDSIGGTYDDPIIFSADNPHQAILHCCGNGRQTCINVEAQNYVAVVGLNLQGGRSLDQVSRS